MVVVVGDGVIVFDGAAVGLCDVCVVVAAVVVVADVVAVVVVAAVVHAVSGCHLHHE